MVEKKQALADFNLEDLPTDFDDFEEDAKEKVEGILDDMDLKSKLKWRKELLRSIKKQEGHFAVLEMQTLQLVSMIVLAGVGIAGSTLVNKYFCDKF